MTTRWTVGIDVGGTFTDAVAVGDNGRFATAKVVSTPDDPSRALLDALAALATDGVAPEAIERLVHGTTVATNALLTGSLARVVLCATDGFTDLLTIRTGQRPDMYDLFQPRPGELVAEADRIAVRERIAADGSAVQALTDEEIGRVVRAVRRRRPASVAIALLFSYVEPRHEERLAAALRAAMPRVPITLSSEVSREVREYPRTVTTAVAAGLRPVMERYLERARTSIAAHGVRAPLLVMESGGGLVPADRATREPHRLILSGPAAGVAGAIELGARLGLQDLLALDMGGTSVDVCLVRDGRAPVTGMQRHDGAPLTVAALDIATAGAGGGSIAWLDPAGALRVGPQSAGAEPGPAAYGRGGDQPTVTDAHLVVGTLDEGTPLAGRLRLDRASAEAALRRLAEPLGLTLDAAAEGILAIATARLAGAVRQVSIERGVDPRGLPLVAFGGAGPLHAARLMRELGLGEIVVPRSPGLLCAVGLAGADERLDAAQTVMARLDPAAAPALAAWFGAAARELRAGLAADGISADRSTFHASADCRYVGQGHELSIPLAGLGARPMRVLAAAFHAAHRVRYGHAAPDEPVEAVTLRLIGVGRLDHPRPAAVEPSARDRRPAAATSRGTRSVLLPGTATRVPVDVWWRDGLRWGDRLDGPCIIEQLDATTLVLAGMRAEVGRWGDLRIRDVTR
ncbi:MAG: hydantoinase/oxoprolinase family protein [Candidatus Limnocylindrales bacterium]|nr:hydantoinase/oxoprolinase family protein [Candidatus Limnocylindrales bacterium]